jgi:hypothetical protein
MKWNFIWKKFQPIMFKCPLGGGLNGKGDIAARNKGTVLWSSNATRLKFRPKTHKKGLRVLLGKNKRPKNFHQPPVSNEIKTHSLDENWSNFHLLIDSSIMGHWHEKSVKKRMVGCLTPSIWIASVFKKFLIVRSKATIFNSIALLM